MGRSWIDDISDSERIMLSTMCRLRDTLQGIAGSCLARHGGSLSRRMLALDESRGKVWSKKSTWAHTGCESTNQGMFVVYAGTLERGIYRIDATLRYEFCINSIHALLPSGPLEIGRDLVLHSGIRPKFHDGPWWTNLPRWTEELSDAAEAEQRRLAILARDAEYARAKREEVIHAGNSAEFIEALRARRA